MSPRGFPSPQSQAVRSSLQTKSLLRAGKSYKIQNVMLPRMNHFRLFQIAVLECFQCSKSCHVNYTQCLLTEKCLEKPKCEVSGKLKKNFSGYLCSAGLGSLF